MELNYQSESNNTQDALYYAQLIANAFAKTLEDNNCLLILTVGLHQQINDTTQDIVAVAETMDNINNITTEDSLTPDSILNSLQSAIQDSKNRCYDCSIKLPKLSFNMDLKNSIGQLKGLLKVFTDLFKIKKLDICQAAYALDKVCLPDILKLITLLLTAYVAIMGLKKLSNISINAFIKGILNSIIAKLLGSVNISINISGSTVGCLIEALKDIASNIPTEQNIRNNFDDETNSSFETNKISNAMTKRLDNALNYGANIANYGTDTLSNINKKISNSEKNLNSVFKYVSDTVNDAVIDVNEYIQSLLNFKIHMECESKRSGMDAIDALNQVNKLINVINLLSSVALSMAKQEVRDKICKSPMNINSLSNNEISDLQLKDLIEDYNQKQVDIINSTPEDLEVLISDKPKEDSLPKIDLLNCSIDDFIQAHTLGNILNTASLQVERELNTNSRIDTTTYNIPEATYKFAKPSINTVSYIDDIINLIYTDPNINSDSESDLRLDTIDINNFSTINTSSTASENYINEEIRKPEEIINNIGKEGISSILEDMKINNQTSSNLSCKSIDEVLNILQQIRR